VYLAVFNIAFGNFVVRILLNTRDRAKWERNWKNGSWDEGAVGLVASNADNVMFPITATA